MDSLKLNLVCLMPVFVITASYANLGTANLVNHTDCLCSINADHMAASCNEVAGSGITIYTFNEGPLPQNEPILYASILDGATGLAPVLPGGLASHVFSTIWVFKNVDGAYTPSSYPATPGGTLYAISLVTKNFGQIAFPVTFADCPAQFTPTTPFDSSIN